MFADKCSSFLLLVLVLGAFLVGLATPRPADADAQAQIVKLDNDLRLDGYDFNFETSNGIKRVESGVVRPGTGKDDDGSIDVNGDFSFTFPDGTPMVVKFVATADGYRPQVTLGQGRSG